MRTEAKRHKTQIQEAWSDKGRIQEVRRKGTRSLATR
jgi:hypothetical protein